MAARSNGSYERSIVTGDECWVEIWNQLGCKLQNEVDRGRLSFVIQCDDVSGKLRAAIFTSPNQSRRLVLRVQLGGRLSEIDIAKLILIYC